MENLSNKDPYFEKFINLTVDFITSEVKDKLKDFKPISEDDKLTYTPKETAKVLNIGINKLYTLLKEDNFPSYKIDDKWFVSRRGLQEWIDLQITNK